MTPSLSSATQRAQRLALNAALLGAAAFGCKGGSRGCTPSSPETTVPTLVVAGEHAPRRALWTASGDLVVVSRRALFRISKGLDPTPTMLPIRGGIWDVVVASGSDQLVALSLSGELWSLRDAALKRIAAIRPSLSLDMSATDEVVSVREIVADRDLTSFYRISDGKLLGRASMRGAALSPSGKLAGDDTGIVSTDGGARRYDNPDGRLAGWIGETALFSTDRGIRWVDVTASAAKLSPLPCTGADTVDASRERVLRLCEDRVVFVDGGSEVDVPIAIDLGAASTLELPPDGDDVLVKRTPMHERPSYVRVSPRTKSAEPASAPLRARRPIGDIVAAGSAAWHLGGEPLASPDGTLTLRMGRGTLFVERAGGAGGRRFGIDPREPEEIRIEPREGGLDVLGVRNDHVEQLVRIGPAAPPRPAAPIPKLDVFAEDTCVRSERRALGDQEIRFNTRSLDGKTLAVCLCRDGVCRRTSLASGDEMLDATATALVARTPRERATEIVVYDHDGHPQRRVPLDRTCESGRARANGSAIALGCDGPSSAEGEIIELALPALTVTRRTRFRAETRHGAPTIVAAEATGYLLLTSGDGGVSARFIEPRSGIGLAEIHAWSNAAIVRFADGRVEPFGDPKALESALFCTSEGSLVPFAACRAAALVTGRFRLE